MVNSGFSTRRIKRYLHRWCAWWVRTESKWQYQELLVWFIETAWDNAPKNIALAMLKEKASTASHLRARAEQGVYATP